jgi:hypothetical protein
VATIFNNRKNDMKIKPQHALIGDKVKFVYHGMERIGYVDSIIPGCLTVELDHDYENKRYKRFRFDKISEFEVTKKI